MALNIDPITRKEMLLANVAGENIALPSPVTREEMFLAALGGADITPPSPVTREEMFLQAAIDNGGSGSGSGGGIPGVYLFHGGADPVDVPDGFVMPSTEDFNPTQIGDPVVFAMLLYCDANFVDEMMGDEFTARLGPLYFVRQSGVEYTFYSDTPQCVFSISGGKITFLEGRRGEFDHIEKTSNLDWMMLVIDMRGQST